MRNSKSSDSKEVISINGSPESKSCLWCYRPFEFRKKWAEVWDEVKFCSDACRSESKNKKSLLHRAQIEAAVLAGVKARKPKSLCPSEIARELFEDWRPQMEPVRQVCRKLHLEKKIVITQKDVPIKELNFKGPIRIKFKT
jgi:hypothetical protein